VVEAIEDGSLALVTPVGSVTVVTDANTRFRIPDVEEPGLGDLDVGGYLGAAGWWEEEENTFHAFVVARLETDRVFPLAGELAGVSDDTLTVETGRGLATVRVDGETVYRVRGIGEPDLGDLGVGMRIVARGTLNLDGSLLAQGVAVPWAGPRPIRLRGEVLAVEGDTFTIRIARGHQSSRQPVRQFKVLTDEATEFRVAGVETPSIADLQVGDRIAGEGVIEEGGTGRAVLVVVLPEQVARLVGEVVAIEGAALRLDTPGGTVDVLTDADTVLRVPGVEGPALDDVKIGDQVTAIGTWEDETTFNAIGVGVHAGRRAGQRCAVRGRVIRVETEHFVLGSPHGPVTVLVDDETRYRVPGVDDPGLDDIKTGASVGVRGMWSEDGTLQATGVAVLGSRRAHNAANGCTGSVSDL